MIGTTNTSKPIIRIDQYLIRVVLEIGGEEICDHKFPISREAWEAMNENQRAGHIEGLQEAFLENMAGMITSEILEPEIDEGQPELFETKF